MSVGAIFKSVFCCVGIVIALLAVASDTVAQDAAQPAPGLDPAKLWALDDVKQFWKVGLTLNYTRSTLQETARHEISVVTSYDDEVALLTRKDGDEKGTRSRVKWQDLGNPARHFEFGEDSYAFSATRNVPLQSDGYERLTTKCEYTLATPQGTRRYTCWLDQYRTGLMLAAEAIGANGLLLWSQKLESARPAWQQPTSAQKELEKGRLWTSEQLQSFWRNGLELEYEYTGLKDTYTQTRSVTRADRYALAMKVKSRTTDATWSFSWQDYQLVTQGYHQDAFEASVSVEKDVALSVKGQTYTTTLVNITVGGIRIKNTYKYWLDQSRPGLCVKWQSVEGKDIIFAFELVSISLPTKEAEARAAALAKLADEFETSRVASAEQVREFWAPGLVAEYSMDQGGKVSTGQLLVSKATEHQLEFKTYLSDLPKDSADESESDSREDPLPVRYDLDLWGLAGRGLDPSKCESMSVDVEKGVKVDVAGASYTTTMVTMRYALHGEAFHTRQWFDDKRPGLAVKRWELNAEGDITTERLLRRVMIPGDWVSYVSDASEDNGKIIPLSATWTQQQLQEHMKPGLVISHEITQGIQSSTRHMRVIAADDKGLEVKIWYGDQGEPDLNSTKMTWQEFQFGNAAQYSQVTELKISLRRNAALMQRGRLYLCDQVNISCRQGIRRFVAERWDVIDSPGVNASVTQYMNGSKQGSLKLRGVTYPAPAEGK